MTMNEQTGVARVPLSLRLRTVSTIAAGQLILPLAILAFLVSSSDVLAQKEKTDAQKIEPEEVKLGRPVEFNRDIYPILENNCVACHNLAIAESRLNLEDIEGIQKGGRRGPSVIAEKPDESLLYLVAARTKKPVMPPMPNDVQADPLTPRELGLLRQWIVEGAKAGARSAGTAVQWNALPEGLNAIHAVRLAENSRTIAAGHGNQVDLYDLDSGQRLQRLLDPALEKLAGPDGQPMYPGGAAHRDFVNAIALSPDGNLLATGGYRTVKIWRRTEGPVTSEWQLPSDVTQLAASADGEWVAAAHEDGKITTWNRRTGVAGPVLQGHAGAVTGLDFTPSLSRRLAVDEEWNKASVETSVAERAERKARSSLERFEARATDSEAVAEQRQELKAAAEAADKALATSRQKLAVAEENRRQFEAQSQARSRLVSVGADKTIRIWDFKGTGVRTLTAPSDCLAVAVHPDGTRLATSHADNVIRIWEIARKGTDEEKPILELKGHSKPVRSLRYTPRDGKLLLSGSEDGAVRVWDSASGRATRTLSLGAAVTSMDISPDGTRVVAGGANNLTRVWTVADGKQIVEASGGVTQGQLVAALTEDAAVAKNLVTLADQKIQAADKLLKERVESEKKATEELKKAEEAQKKAQGEDKAAQDKLKTAIATAEAKKDDKNAAAERDKAQKAADTTAQALKTAADALTSAKRNLTLSKDTLKRAESDLETAKTSKQQAEEHQKVVDAQLAKAKESHTASRKAPRVVRYSPDGRCIVSILEDGTVQVWSAASGAGLRTEVPTDGASLMQFVDEQSVAGIDSKRVLRVRDSGPHWQLAAVLGPNPKTPLRLDDSEIVDRVLALAFSPDGKSLATGGGDPSRSGELLIWNVEAGAIARRFEDAHSDTVFGIEFSRDGKHIVTGAADKFVKLFNAETGEHLRSYEGHTNHVMDVSFMADGSRIVSAGADNAIKVWNTETGEQARTISNYSKQVTSIGFVGIGQDIISGGGDKTVRLHRISNGQNLRTFAGATDFVYAVDVSRDQSLVVAGGEDGILRIWDGKTGRSLLNVDTSTAP